MKKEIQAYIAHYAGQLIADWTNSSICEKDQSKLKSITTKSTGFDLRNHPARTGCNNNKCRDGVNYCIINDEKDHHICMSIYGKLFDGYDHASTSHFSGMVDDDFVELYDYNESDFFRFEKA